MRRNKKHIANIISLARMLGIGIVFWLTPYETNMWLLNTVIIYAIICLTDLLDGWVARKLNIVSEIGKVLDPLADKIVVLVFLPLLEMQVITSFPVFIILAREFAIMGLRVAAAKKGSIIAATTSGKIKTAFTLPICGILFARVPVETLPLPTILLPLEWIRLWIFSWPHWIISVLIWTTVLITIWSFFDYFGSFIWEEYAQTKKAKNKLKKIIPNTVSSINMISGLASIIVCIQGLYHIGVVLILSSLILDALDGNLARKFQVESKLGAKLDSKADFISFGIAPSVLSFLILKEQLANIPFALIISGTLAFIYYAAVHFRLRRFDQSGHSDFFEGLPSPIGAAFVAVSAISPWLSSFQFFVPIILISSGLMMSKIPYPHTDTALKKTFMKHIKIPTLIFYILTIINLLYHHTAKHFFIYEMLIIFTGIYIMSPLFIKSQNSSK